jgi:hypothetical protein
MTEGTNLAGSDSRAVSRTRRNSERLKTTYPQVLTISRARADSRG